MSPSLIKLELLVPFERGIADSIGLQLVEKLRGVVTDDCRGGVAVHHEVIAVEIRRSDAPA